MNWKYNNLNSIGDKIDTLNYMVYISHIPALYSRLNPDLSVDKSDWNRIVIADPLEVKMDVSRPVPVSDASSLASFESPS